MSCKSGKITLRCNPDEVKRIEAEAMKANMKISKFVRYRALNYPVIAQLDLQTLNLLRKLGGLVKYVGLRNEGIYDSKVSAALEALTILSKIITRQLEQRVQNVKIDEDDVFSQLDFSMFDELEPFREDKENVNYQGC